MNDHGERNLEQQKQLAESWLLDFGESLNSAIKNPESDFDQIMDVVWEKGILNRICPDSQEVKAARKNLGRNVYEGQKEDSDLYWRLLASAENVEYAAKNSLTLASGDLSPMFEAFVAMNSPEIKRRFFQKDDDGRELDKVIDAIRQKAISKISDLEKKQVPALPAYGKKINVAGIDLKVRYTPNGQIALEAFSPEDHEKIGQMTDYTGTISPKKLFELGFEEVK